MVVAFTCFASQSTSPPSAKCILLITSVESGPSVGPAQNAVRNMLTAHKVKNVEELDGAQAEFKDRRNELCHLSEKFGIYPQLFIEDLTTGEVEFVGDHEMLEELNECNSLDEATLAAHPGISLKQRLAKCV
eukprot:INCI9879.1.p1 GENE.INCI9879.1~~INCI9879.1.p1  ORF type:complete len:132 (-),score=21.01 INCI9879.1:66-461(-)